MDHYDGQREREQYGINTKIQQKGKYPEAPLTKTSNPKNTSESCKEGK